METVRLVGVAAIIGLCAGVGAGLVAIPGAHASPACDRAGRDAMVSMLKQRESLRISHAAAMQNPSATHANSNWADAFKAENRQIEIGYERNCLPGDTISIPSAYQYRAARLCDPDKSISDNGNVTMCTMRSDVGRSE